jgi:diguanylate cyclase (GGDEF)-like protein
LLADRVLRFVRIPAAGKWKPAMDNQMSANPIRLLFVEDVEHEAELAALHLKRAGISCTTRRVETEAALRQAIAEFDPSIILSDFTLPQFDGLSALRVARELAPDVPFVFVSGTIGEERAIDALLCGAMDYVLKTNLARLGPSVRRALAEAAARAERIRQEAQIARLDRVLRMLSGVNGLVVRIRERGELLQETCRLAVKTGGYGAAVVLTKAPGTFILQPAAWNGTEQQAVERLRLALAESAGRKGGIVSRVLESGKPYVCNDVASLDTTAVFDAVMMKSGFHSLVALPLSIDNTVVGVLFLAAHEAGAVSDEELRMLREVSGNLSFALQYLQQDTKVKFLSHFDSQTGLAKRPLFCERVARLIGSPAGRRSRYGIAVIDIERLSLINDSYGRRTGDLLLQHVADRLKRRFPQTEHIAHIGGGTFAIIRDLGVRSSEEMLNAAREHAVAVFGEPFVIEDREIPVAVRSGFALFPEHGRDASTLVQNAEAALRDARLSGERQLHYSAEKHSEMMGRLALEHKLRLALEKRQFVLHYQPKVNVITRRIEGVEALLRWRDPDAGLVSPAAFLPLLEATGMIVDVGEWVIQQAAADCQQWMRAGLAPVRIAVNISPLQLRLPDFTPGFLKAVQGWSNSASGLDIEITEGALTEDCAAEVKKLQYLRGLGVRIAIDDFGTGYSSLSRLSSLPIDTLKIDRSFVRPVPTDPSARVMVKTIVTLARALNLKTVAEGVETQEELDFLWQVGCEQSQGFLHSKPVPADEFAEFLERGRGPMLVAGLREPDDDDARAHARTFESS